MAATPNDSNKKQHKTSIVLLICMIQSFVLTVYILFAPYLINPNYKNNGSLHPNIQFLLLWIALTLITFGIDVLYNKTKK